MIGFYCTDWDGGWRPSDRLPRNAVDEAIEATGKAAKRAGGKLPSHVMVYYAMACATRRELFEWRWKTATVGSSQRPD